MSRADAISPFVRIGLYILTGWLGGSILDPETVDIIRTDPAILMAISGGVAALWYALARGKGWST